MPIIQVRNVKIHYFANFEFPAEDRPSVLLLHAFPLSALMWQEQYAGLGPYCNLIAPDYPGFGGSALDSASANLGTPLESLREALTLETIAQDLHSLLEKLHLTHVVVVGLSWGGYIALEFCRAYPESLAALVLADTKALADTAEGRQKRLEFAEQTLQQGTAYAAAEMLPKLLSRHASLELRGQVEELLFKSSSSLGVAAAQFGMAARPDYTFLLEKLHCPTLLLAGEYDQLTPVGLMQEMQSKIAGSQLAVIPQAGHLANLENPQAFNLELLNFLVEYDFISLRR